MQQSPGPTDENNAELRREAVERLRGIKDDANIPILLAAMEDTSWRVRKTAVEILFDGYPMEKYIDGLIRLLSIEDNAGARNSAIEALARLGRKATVFLVGAFRTPNRDVRKFIIDVLGEQNDARSLPLMLDALRDEDENVRATAVEHLGRTGEVSAVDALIEILDGEDLWTAYPAADALGRIGNAKAVPHLVKALGKKPLREPVLKSLGRFADVSTLRHIIPLLEEPSRNVQEQALRTVEIFYRTGVNAEIINGAMRRILGERAMEILIGHAWSNRKEVRLSAIVLLGLMKDEAAYGPLLDISQEEEFAAEVKRAFVFIGREKPESLMKLFETDNPHQMRFICEVTGEIVSPVYYGILEGLLSHDDGHVRATAALSIARLGDERAVPGLMGLLTDRYEDVQEAAVNALFQLKEALSPRKLVGMLRNDNSVLRKNIARLLGKLRTAEAVDELGFVLKDANVEVRSAVVAALASIGTESAMRYLSRALTDEEADIRIAAVLSLGAVGGEGALEALTLLTSDPATAVRVAATKALGIRAENRSVKTLIGLLSDPSGFVVSTAIESLAAIGGDEARKAIAGMLSSADDEVKRTAIAALASFDRMQDDLVPFLHDRDWATRIAAVRALRGKAEGNVRKELERLLDTEEDPAVKKAVEESLFV